jgi:hypothetical protein
MSKRTSCAWYHRRRNSVSIGLAVSDTSREPLGVADLSVPWKVTAPAFRSRSTICQPGMADAIVRRAEFAHHAGCTRAESGSGKPRTFSISVKVIRTVASG